jgi:polyketide cyclase/dehydrase/lipid transport protein
MSHPGVSLHRLFRPKWPLVFALTPSEQSFADEAEYKIDNQALIPALPEQVYDEFIGLENGLKWVNHLVRLDQLTPGAPPDRRIYDETWSFMTVRIRTLEADRGRRWVGSIDHSSLPLSRQMLQVVTFEPLPNGCTHFHWRLYYTPSLLVRPLLRSLQRAFEQTFRQDTERLAAFFQETRLAAGSLEEVSSPEKPLLA